MRSDPELSPLNPRSPGPESPLEERYMMKLEPGTPLPHDLLAAPKRLSTPVRIVCGIFGVGLIALVVLGVLAELAYPSTGSVWAVLVWAFVVAMGAVFVYAAVRGREPFSRTEEIPSPLFYALADPTRPLPDDAPISGGAPTRRGDAEP